MSALMTEIADALSHHPEEFTVGRRFASLAGKRIHFKEWPSFDQISAMFAMWRVKRLAVLARWQQMSRADRLQHQPPPEAGGGDPTRAWV